MRKERIKQMVALCQLYYQEGYTQQQLADKFNISRPQVSRLMTAAKEAGIVEFRINNPFSNESIIGNKLISTYNLTDAVIVETANIPKDQSSHHVANTGAFYLENVIKQDNNIGVMAGRSIQQIVQRTRDNNERNVHVVPLVGGIGIRGANWHANSNVIQLAENMNFDYYVLNSPAIVSSLEMKSQFVQEEEIKEVMQCYDNLHIAIVGIGEISDEATFFKTISLNHDDLQEVKDAGAVSVIGKIFLNSQGEAVAKGISDRMIGISEENLQKTPLVIGIATGLHKIEAIQAGLLGRWIDVLVTDVQTGEQLLKQTTKEMETCETY